MGARRQGGRGEELAACPSLTAYVEGALAPCNLGHLTFGALGHCKPNQVVRGPKAAWGMVGVSRGQWCPTALFAVVRLTASESNSNKKTPNHLDGIIVNFFSLLFYFGGRQAALLLSVC